MRMLLVSPFPRWFLLCRQTAGQHRRFDSAGLCLSGGRLALGYRDAGAGATLTVLPALVLSGMMLGALGMLLSSAIRQLENFAGVMNFVIFPMFFASSALYPLWLVQQSSPVVYTICRLNPFTYAVELIRFALYAKIDWLAFAVVTGAMLVFMAGAIVALRSGARTDRPPRRRRCMRRVLLACVPLLLAIPTRAAPPNADPNWPCQQIKVPELSVAAMWTGPPIDPYFATWAEDPSVADLVRRVTQRRLPIEQAKAEVAAFAQQQGQDKLPKLLALFAGVFDSLNRERTSILAGLDRFGARQKQLAASIRGENEQLRGHCGPRLSPTRSSSTI